MFELVGVTRVGVVACLALLFAQLAFASCDGARERAAAPAVAYDGERYTVAWQRGRAVYVQQFADGDGVLREHGKRAAIYRDDELRGGVSLVPIRDGFFAFVVQHVEGSERLWDNETVLVRLGRDGAPTDKARAFSRLDVLCDVPVVVADLVMVPHIERARSHRYPYDDLGVLALDTRGEVRARWTLGNQITGCGSAAHGSTLAIAWTRWSNDAKRRQLWLTLYDRGAGERAFKLREGDVDPWPVRVARARGTWVVLSSDGESLRATTVATDGAIVAESRLPGVAMDSVDLAATSRGAFLTWIKRGTLHVRGLGDAENAVRARVAGSASETRAIGVDDHCVAAWTVGTKHPHVLAVHDCP